MAMYSSCFLMLVSAISAPESLHTFKEHTLTAQSVLFSPDGKRLISGGGDGEIVIWDAVTHKRIAKWVGHVDLDAGYPISSIGCPPKSDFFVTAGWDRKIQFWSWQGKLIRTLKHGSWSVVSVCFSPDGKSLAASYAHHTVVLWDVATGKKKWTIEVNDVMSGKPVGSVSSIAFSPDGKLLAGGCSDGTVRLWNSNRAKQLSILKGHASSVESVAFSPNGKSLAASSDKVIHLWDLQKKESVAIIAGHKEFIFQIVFSPDGATLASASEDKTIRLWDVKKKRERAVLKGHTDWVLGIAYSPDGKRLASASRDGTVRIWSAK